MFKNVWLIDDDPVNNFLTEMLISVNNFAENVKTFTSAEEPLNLIKEGLTKEDFALPEIIFLDINMPRVSGWDFLKSFSEFPQVKNGCCEIYMLSSSVDPKDIQMAKVNVHVRNFISKPLDIEDLEIIKLQKSGEEF